MIKIVPRDPWYFSLYSNKVMHAHWFTKDATFERKTRSKENMLPILVNLWVDISWSCYWMGNPIILPPSTVHQGIQKRFLILFSLAQDHVHTLGLTLFSISKVSIILIHFFLQHLIILPWHRWPRFALVQDLLQTFCPLLLALWCLRHQYPSRLWFYFSFNSQVFVFDFTWVGVLILILVGKNVSWVEAKLSIVPHTIWYFHAAPFGLFLSPSEARIQREELNKSPTLTNYNIGFIQNWTVWFNWLEWRKWRFEFGVFPRIGWGGLDILPA